MPVLYMTVGVPGVGKSTWIAQQDWAMQRIAVVSTDKHVEQHAADQGRTYSEVFTEYMPTALRLMLDDVCRARDDKRDIIWDQTSTTVISRAKKLHILRHYYAIAVVFTTPSIEELHTRLTKRPGKHVPEKVVRQMIDNFEMPTEQEGFKEIWIV